MAAYFEAMLFEVRCPGCGRLGWCPCEDCISLTNPVSPGPSDVGLGAATGSDGIAGAETTCSLFWHEGVAREFVFALKFRRERSIARWLGDALADTALSRITSPGINTTSIDLVTWPPTTTARRRKRGFDQAEILARRVARRLAIPARRLLVRTSTASQSGLGRTERLAGPVFVLAGAIFSGDINPSSPRKVSVLVVDDVLTTGATLRAAVAAVKSGAPTGLHECGKQAVSEVVVHAASCTRARHQVPLAGPSQKFSSSANRAGGSL